ncbi:MAG: excinuclease ABC subunit UvrC [Bacteroidaceae bacterium]|nr:excinuclease ABC subunit UvrC [Bacteroidaceae bacterium]
MVIRDIVNNLPESPGCYQYLDDTGRVIYVGKAKNLKRRVSSYFNNPHQTAKTAVLVKHIADIKYVVVRTEEDALLLENNLIKRYKPRYNILLKDDKTYPSIIVTAEPFPRIFQTRNIVRGAGTYYGPYSHIPTLKALLELIKQLYPLRTCRHALTEEGIREHKWDVCLEYHIKNCEGCCVGRVSREAYNRYVDEARAILKGDTKELLARLRREMEQCAAELRFEDAQRIKEKYVLVDDYRARSEVVSSVFHNVDVFNIECDEAVAYINYLHVVNGAINQAFTFEFKKRLDESPEELLAMGVVEMRQRFGSQSREIIIPFEFDLPLEGVTLTVPQRGDKHKLLALSYLNVKQYKLDRLKQAEKLNPEQKQVRLMKEIQDALRLPRLPMRIECFDNSNISGADAVAGCVVFERCKPSKKEYRKFKIRTVSGPDDYASMQEVVLRKYHRAIEENTPLPDLIITDGGRGQMEVVRRVVEDQLHLNIPIAGLAKDDRHRTHELLYGFPPVVVGLKQDSPLFRLMTQIQDEVHRYAITFHRDQRSRRQTRSELDQIPGIGPRTKEILLKHFRSVKRIREADLPALSAVIGESKAKILLDYFGTTK